MNVIRKAVTTLGGILLAALLIAALAPKAAHGIVAALIRDVDQPARRPFVTSCSFPSSAAGTNGCFTGLLPSGAEVVIEAVSISAVADPSNTRLGFALAVTTSGVPNNFFPSALTDDGLIQPTASNFAAVQTIRLYADPGSSVACGASSKSDNPIIGMSGTCVISGYTVSLP